MGQKKIEALLQGKEGYDLLPFFWQHGEDEATLRQYMEVIESAHCRAVCVESRPHPDFMGETWWRDMDIILDEAKKRYMKIWILDDSHFPTGYANGALKGKPLVLRRQSIYTKSFDPPADGKLRVSLKEIVSGIPVSMVARGMAVHSGIVPEQFFDDRVLALSILREDRKVPEEITFSLEEDTILASVPSGVRRVFVTILTRNAGMHRDYINMMDPESVRVLLDTVYEPHYARYAADFGKTIAGFFSDEPELGNSYVFNHQALLGTDLDFPWSRTLEEALPRLLGMEWKALLPLLWDDCGSLEKAAWVRRMYMESVTRLVEQHFSRQIGSWCEAHGVSYIGHVIEDNNQHARTGTSLGHYFRGLTGQHMAGIDDIGGQVIPFGEDTPPTRMQAFMGGRDGEFYHFCLGALGASFAAIDPIKQGRCMCEIFGAYGWELGPRGGKYLADHFMVQGINRFVPHAFSPKAYPDPDCPPHFYARGNNPQYRAFAQLMAYMNRVCTLISDGKPVVETAVLYHGEQEWMGRTLLDQKILRPLMEKQIMVHLLPTDIFVERDRFRVRVNKGALTVNGNVYRTLLIPGSNFLSETATRAIQELRDTGVSVAFVSERPSEIISDSSVSLHMEDRQNLMQMLASVPLISPEDTVHHVRREIFLEPGNKRIRYFHYRGEEEVFYLVNEDSEPWEGRILLPTSESLYRYDAWRNRVETVRTSIQNGKTIVEQRLNSSESLILITGRRADLLPSWTDTGDILFLDPPKISWTRSVCKAIDYPCFTHESAIDRFLPYSDLDPAFSGLIAYDCNFSLEAHEKPERALLKITAAGEDVELFLNGVSLGIQVLQPFVWDVTANLRPENNHLRVEVATTLERETGANPENQAPTGLFGHVQLILQKGGQKNG